MSFLNHFIVGNPRDTTLASVVRNLLYLLNSRRNFGSLLCNFGISDYLAEQGGRNAIRVVLREIHETIQIYEPRLLVSDLRAVGRDDKLRVVIELTGQLATSYWGAHCQLILLFQPLNGQVEIEVGRGA